MFKRIGSIGLADATRAQFTSAVSRSELKKLAGHERLRVLQCSAPVKDSVWTLLDECFFAVRPDVQLRVYGHYSTGCDLGFAGRLKHVRRFAADNLRRATHVEQVAAIPNLESLSLGIFELESFRVLEMIPATLTELHLGRTRSSKPSLAPLHRFPALKVVYLEGQSKGIEVLGELENLEDVTLRSITTPDLGYLTPLEKLRSLDIKLGGIRSFRGIEGKASIEYLEIWQVRRLPAVDIMAALPGLQNLFLQSLPQVGSLPALANSWALRRIVLENLKGLRDLSALESAPALEEFALLNGRQQTPEQLLPVLRNPAVRRVCGFFGSDKKNQTFSRLREEHGKQEWSRIEEFEYW